MTEGKTPNRDSNANEDQNGGDAASLAAWLCEPMPKDVADSIERTRRAPDVRYVAVMPDVHLSRDVCVGVAMATDNLLYPDGVGGDIGCGMAALAFDAEDGVLASERNAAQLLARLYERVPSNKHRAPRELEGSALAEPLSHPALETRAARDGRWQLGTLGRGNHFLEFQSDQENRLWVMVHTGSRGIGQAISDHHRAAAHSSPVERPALDARTALGESYLNDVAWARAYAAENRLAILRAVESILRDSLRVAVDWSSLIHADHNHVARETHFGAEWLVHRKGAQPAGKGVAGVIPGSMGAPSFHVEGRGNAAALDSSSHGAGRRLSRQEARRMLRVTDMERELRGIWFDRRLRERLKDEAPRAYKDVRKVLAAQRELVRVTRELRPLLSYKGA